MFANPKFRIIYTLLVASVVLLSLDAFYISCIYQSFFQQIRRIQQTDKINVRLPVAVLCYILLVLGLWFFILRHRRPYWEAGVLGVVVYGVYETTNYSLLTHWSPVFAVVDTVWGGVLMSATTAITYSLGG